MWTVYFLQQLDGTKTYIGATLDIDRRLKQHNGVLKGGARATAGFSWKRVCHVTGFPHERGALQFEWAWKHFSKKMAGNAIHRRVQALLYLLGCDKPTSKADDYQEYAENLQVVWEDESINPSNYI